MYNTVRAHEETGWRLSDFQVYATTGTRMSGIYMYLWDRTVIMVIYMTPIFLVHFPVRQSELGD